MQKTILALAAAAAALIAVAAVVLLMQKPDAGTGTPLTNAALDIGGAEIGGPFTLVDTSGKSVTDAQVIDGPTFLYFGYTFCPDICPVDTQVMVETVDLMAVKGVEVTPVFISVDHERDTPDMLKDWAEVMHPKMVALTGSPEQIRAAADAYKVYYKKQVTPDSAAGFLYSHTGYTYLVTPEGLKAVFRNGFPPEELAAESLRLLAAGN